MKQLRLDGSVKITNGVASTDASHYGANTTVMEAQLLLSMLCKEGNGVVLNPPHLRMPLDTRPRTYVFNTRFQHMGEDGTCISKACKSQHKRR